MRPEEQEQYREEYAEAKRKGVPFFPDAIFKDAVMALLIFLAILALATFAGASLEEIADPSDANFTPRPEWYFLFLFQLFKFFPGSWEVVGVFVIPMLALTFLITLPWTDRSARRHWSGRPVVTSITLFMLAGALFLTVQALTADPPPAAAAAAGDRTAQIYSDNCAGCHGSFIAATSEDDLFQTIQGGTHDGMPAWNTDLSSDEIDALVGYILSPTGHAVFSANCAECHEMQSLAGADSIKLRQALDEGPDFEPHNGLGLPVWSDALDYDDQARLLNFLAAPDGQRLWTQECAACHGRVVAFAGEREELIEIVRRGGGHLEMPAFEASLGPEDIESLARYVTDPQSVPGGAALFGRVCTACHATRVPNAPDLETARELIATGGAHEDMPVWGEVLTDQQIDALVDYVLTAAELPDLGVAQALFAQNCSACHGDLGEGGVNPARPGDIIAPISTSEYLATRDDTTLRAIISQGQPNFGMSPFADAFGGPLTPEQIDLLVSYLRAWQENPPVDLPPDVPGNGGPTGNAASSYQALCAQCHGPSGEGGVGIAFDAAWQAARTDQQMFDDINLGHQATAMIAWGEVLSSQQIQEMVAHIRTLTGEPGTVAALTYDSTIRPIFDAYCSSCHGSLGGWTGTSYTEALAAGAAGPVIIPGDPDNSRLVQSLIGTHPDGIVMPPSVEMSLGDIQKIIDWIAAGAPES